MWDDSRFYQMSDIGRVVYLYVLTSPLGNGLGCFKAGKSSMIEDSRMDEKWFLKGFAEGLIKGLFEYDEDSRVIFIPKYFDRNPPSNPNTVAAFGKAYLKIPDCELKKKMFLVVKKFITTKDN